MTQRGFSFTELMLVCALVAILSSLAYPAYTNFLLESRREQAKVWLSACATELSRHFSEHQTFSNLTQKPLPAAPENILALAHIQALQSPYYKIILTKADHSSYQLKLIPQGIQQQDQCGELSITHTGQTGVINAAITAEQCW